MSDTSRDQSNGSRVGATMLRLTETVNDLVTRVERLEQFAFRNQRPARINAQLVEFDFSDVAYIKELVSTLNRCLALLDYVFQKDPNHPGLTTDEIETVFRERFALPIPLTTISSSLLAVAGKLVTRVKVEGRPVKYRYRILPKGAELIQKKITELTRGK